MATAYDAIYDVFYRKIERDEDFFQYFNLTQEEAVALAQERAHGYLKEAAALLVRKCQPDISFAYDDTAQTVGTQEESLTDTEIDLLANLMFEAYLAKDIARLRVMNVNYTPTDLQVFSPSAGRKTFMEMYTAVQAENRQAIDDYKSRDRLTGALKAIDYAAFTEEE